VFQSFALMPHMSVLDNAAFGLILDGVEKTQAHERAQQALEQVGLGTQSNSYPSQLSGGMQQRVGLARALAIGSELMLMDEAFSALDPLIRTEMQDELVKLQEENGNTIIFISHDLDEAIRIGDRIAIMESGEIVQIGTPEEILENPANDYVASFFKGVSVGNILTARHLAKTNICTIPNRPGQGIKAMSQLLEDSDHDFAYITEPDKTFIGVVSMRSLKKAQSKGDDFNAVLLGDITHLEADKTINDIIGDMSDATCPLPVVDEANKFIGVVTHACLLKALDRS
jgi:glycine betaine/proline transport system ATP-binding protein